MPKNLIEMRQIGGRIGILTGRRKFQDRHTCFTREILRSVIGEIWFLNDHFHAFRFNYIDKIRQMPCRRRNSGNGFDLFGNLQVEGFGKIAPRRVIAHEFMIGDVIRDLLPRRKFGRDFGAEFFDVGTKKFRVIRIECGKCVGNCLSDRNAVFGGEPIVGISVRMNVTHRRIHFARRFFQH